MTDLKGPILDDEWNFPDPCIHVDGNRVWAFGTNRYINSNPHQINVQVAYTPIFEDTKKWELMNQWDAMPIVPKWVATSNKKVWGPSIHKRKLPKEGDDPYVMYFSAAHEKNAARHCIGVATAKVVQGPYTGLDDPLICPIGLGAPYTEQEYVSEFSDISIFGTIDFNDFYSEGGAIDPDAGADEDGSPYLVYKTDGNSLNTNAKQHPTPIYLQKMQDDGITKVGDRIKLIDRIPEEDGPLTEAPSLRYLKGPSGSGPKIYYLFYSTHVFSDDTYDVKYATSDKIDGPYTRRGQLLKSGMMVNGKPLTGPGGLDIITLPNYVMYFVFHGIVTFKNKVTGELSRNIYGAQLKYKNKPAADLSLTEANNDLLVNQQVINDINS